MKKLLKKTFGKRTENEPGADPESSSTEAVSVIPERFGLLLLAESAPGSEDRETYPVDIIAVHGLNGDAYRTWKHENQTLWLRDLLPSSLPGSRIFTFGYPSHVAFSTSFAKVQEYSRRLLSSIRDIQGNLNGDPRPIIFICHSLGGIVCKQALVFAHEDDAIYGRVLNSVVGVAFLGTPHRGSSAANLGSVVGRIINSFSATTSAGLQTRTIRTDLLDYLKYDSRDLHDLNNSMRNRLTDLMIISFYESEVQPPLSSIVDRASAVLNIPQEEIIPLYANHRDLCRFPGENDDYKAVSGAIRRIARVAQRATDRASTHSSQMTLNDSEKSCMRLLSDFDLSDYQAMLPTPAGGTCQWILSHPLCVYWLEKAENTLLWLTGHPGCGKTIMSYFLAKHLKDSPTSQTLNNVCIFFCDDKISKQKDARHVLIGLILQLIHRHRSLVRHANKVYEMHGQNIVRSFTALWALFVKVATDPRCGPTYIIIDAVDECHEVTRHLLLGSIRSFLANLNHSMTGGQHVKFVLTSRPSLVDLNCNVERISEHRIPIDEGQRGHDDDIRMFIEQKVDQISQRRHFPPEVQDFLRRTLYSRSGQTFLWIHMVLASLESSLLSSKKDIQDIMLRIPPDLETTYLKFFSAIAPGHHDIASKLLKLILGTLRPLTLDEINIAFTIEPSHRKAEEVASNCQTAIQHTLQGVLGPLVRVSDSKVTLVHQSVKEFILQHMGSKNTLSLALGAISAEDCALMVASVCIDYLMLNNFAKNYFTLEKSPTDSISDTSDSYSRSPGSTSGRTFWDDDVAGLGSDVVFRESGSLDEDACQYLVSNYGFYRYAALHWTEHFALCERFAPIRLRQKVHGLLDINTTNCSNWLRFLFTESAGRDQSIPSSHDFTTLTAYFNLAETLHQYISSQDVIPKANLGCALFWGAEQGHSKIITILLQAGADPNEQISGRQTALIAACKNGHTDCSNILIAHDRTDLNMRGKGGRTALSFACGGGHVQIVQELLKQDGCKADEEDDSGGTALFWAAGGVNISIVSLLVREATVDVNHRDKKGRTTVSWAAGDGMDDVLKILLRVPGIDVNLQDNRGRSPLSWAAGSGCAAAVRVLMRDRKVDKASVDQDKRNAISWACAGGHLDALRMLLKYNCPGVDDRDVDGWSPLAWAIQNNSVETVETLISNRSVHLEQGDHSGTTPLSWAVEYGHIEVVKALLRAGADPNSKSQIGRTPLSRAEKLGRNDIVKELYYYLNRASEPKTRGHEEVDRSHSTEAR